MRTRTSSRLAAGLALACLTASGSSFADPPPPPKVATCSAKQVKLFASVPASTIEFVYGAGEGRAYDQALAASRIKAAEAFGIEVKSITTDRQSLEQGSGGTREASSLEILAQTKVQRVLEGCQVLETCRDGAGEASYHVLTRCSRKSQDERERESLAAIARLPVCDGGKPWTTRSPAMTPDHVFGVGLGRTLEAAEASAKVRAAETLGVDVRSRTSDRQVLWQEGGKGGERSEFEQVADTFVARRLEGCDVVDRCRDGAGGGASVLLQCFRRSQFEREVERLGATMAPKFPKDARILVVPGTDKAGFITGLGELGTSALRAAVDKALPPGASLLRVQQWEPEALHEVGRKHGATHLLRFEYVLKGAQAAHLEAWLQRAENDVDVPGTTVVADVELDDSAASLLDARGPLLPMKDALSVAAELSDRRLEATIAPRMPEGSEVAMEFQVPKGGYLYVFSIEEDGDVTMLRPMAPAPDARVSPGAVRFPDGDFVRLVGAPLLACGVPGRKVARENVKAVLTAKPLDLPAFDRDAPFLAFAPKGPRPVTSLLEALNKARRAGAVIADVTRPYLIETTSRGRGGCP